MKESGIINRNLAAVISEQGHGDLLMVTGCTGRVIQAFICREVVHVQRDR
jgi:D-ribose pyranose/furanose isomerase RbsD